MNTLKNKTEKSEPITMSMAGGHYITLHLMNIFLI